MSPGLFPLSKYRSDGFLAQKASTGSIVSVPDKLLAISGLRGRTIADALSRVQTELEKACLSVDDLVQVQLFVRDLSKFRAYHFFFDFSHLDCFFVFFKSDGFQLLKKNFVPRGRILASKDLTSSRHCQTLLQVQRN